MLVSVGPFAALTPARHLKDNHDSSNETGCEGGNLKMIRMFVT